MIEIGSGCEGVVHQIAPNLVRKVWVGSWWSDTSVPGGYLKRFDEVKKAWDKLPSIVQNLCRIPEFAGWEIDAAGRFVSYHEFIDGPQLDYIKWFVAITILERYFYDVGGTNLREKDGVAYLIDVAPRDGRDFL